MANKECSFLAIDFSQIELRVAAHESLDPTMLDIYWNDGDIHMTTACAMFGLPPDKIDDKAHRRPAKCFHPDTEVLTTQGWKRIVDLRDGVDCICQAWPENGSIRLEWTRNYTSSVRENHFDHLVHLKTEGIDLRLTPDHRCLIHNRKQTRYKVVMPHEVQSFWSWPNAGQMDSYLLEPPDERLLRIAVAVQADGSIGPRHTTRNIRFGFTKKRKIERMDYLLSGIGHKRVERSINGKDGVFYSHFTPQFWDNVMALLEPDKSFRWSWLQFPYSSRETILDEARYWDGHEQDKWRMYSISSTDKKSMEVLQAIATLNNRKTSIRREAQRNSNAKDMWRLSIKRRNASRAELAKPEYIPYTGDIAVISVPSTFLVVRDGGVPVITGQTVNFGTIYLISAKGLWTQFQHEGLTQFSEDDCQDFLDSWRERYPGFFEWVDEVMAEARRTGMVRDMFGRIRFVPELQSSLSYVREAGIRQAVNAPIQSGAGGILKEAIRRLIPVINNLRNDYDVVCRPLLQIHDELIFEVEDEMLPVVAPMFKGIMESAAELAVPVKVDCEVGKNWKELEAYKP